MTTDGLMYTFGQVYILLIVDYDIKWKRGITEASFSNTTNQKAPPVAEFLTEPT
ncbi:hypothetical protein Hanom_Chr12g01148341 [Helianthus anomalus]